jgi:hypothetical protein
MFKFTDTPVTNVADIHNYMDAMSFVMHFSTEMSDTAIRANDVAFMEALRADVVTSRDALVEILGKRYDYLTWFSFSNYTNHQIELLKFDQTGVLLQVMDMLAKFDGQKYYDTYVTPFYGVVSVDEVRAHYINELNNLDQAIELMRERAQK